MHYGDEELKKHQVIQIVVYKHTNSGVNGEELPPYYAVNSLFEAKHIHLHDLVCLYYQADFILQKPMQLMPEEHWYAVSLILDDNDNFKVVNIEVVDTHPNELYRLH